MLIQDKTISLGQGVYRNVEYVNCIFKRCDLTIFNCCKFINCTFKNNYKVEFKQCSVDDKTVIKERK